MTTVYSKSHLIQIEFSPAACGATNLTWNHQHKATANTSELLDALDAVPREDFDKAVALSEQRQTEFEKAEATIERVEVLAGKWVLMGGVTRQRGFELSAALNPPKPFELPITVPARIEARPDWWAEDDPEGGRMVLKLWTDGSALIWSTEDGDDGYSPEQVMREFTDHRLLDGEAL